MFNEAILIPFLKKFDQYPYRVKLEGKTYDIGEGEPEFTVNLRKPLSMTALMASTSLALGEAYMDGSLEIEGDLYYALDHFMGQMDKFSLNVPAMKSILHTSTSRKNQQNEVQSHYDIGNDFYKLWLDESLSYSCGYFLHEDDSLYQAQVNKVDYILKKLCLKEGMTLLDIGCGWGFLLLEAAKKYGVRGAGITLSEEQHKEFQRRIVQEHLEDRLTVELMDYRALPKYGTTFDRVVSVGMVEHVGRENYPLFLDCVKQVMAQGGLFLLHFISGMTEHDGDPWIKKYIFPGGVIPTLREMIAHAADLGFHTMDVENLRLHYTRTLLCWAENFRNHLDEVREMFDDRFIRMWELYLCSCAATFHNGVIDLHQILFTKGINNDLPMVRWY